MQGLKQSDLKKKNQVIFLPINKTQSYTWGSTDSSSLVGIMTQKNLNYYAEFWMGTHPNGQSRISSQLSLKEYLNMNQIEDLQFLFKILSIQKCLSIQAHPNEQEAKQLNKKFPEIYVDDKDKPEMFLTLSHEFELFLGFVEEKEFKDLLNIQPFKRISVQIPANSYENAVIWMIQQLVKQQQFELKENIQTLFQTLSQLKKQKQIILKKLFDEFGYDVGILVCCLLKYHKLPRYSCFGIEPGVPHAYIKGQCFELMKSSDNVVRLGLTPKQKDIPNLIKILRNNFNRKYAQIQPIYEKSVQKFQWKSYSITKIILRNQFQQINISANSIGITINGHGAIKISEGLNSQLQLKDKYVFFLKKGVYKLRGQGEVFIASK